ncbi:chaperone for protein-folding within the ER, fungal-domain-containing protein [Cristinia sonorae]|uniref:Protein ROT1 n=1 Tax=Cristinia sonorae TaxID=1940300 RepID=A0A8K0XKF3_9AGAR|nr:chaperone for protein-folding within the ER, fungal-domain-containing protein [Cristinia sonorae]
MLFTSLVSLFLLASPALAQGDISAAHNLTSLVGTWSSGSRNVVTGPGFANPNNRTFIYPPTAGVSYSFTGDGFFESARYRFNGNATDPHCITGVMVWIHGEYTLNDNSSMTLMPFSDGYQQVQDPCAAESNFIEQYNSSELYQSWRIFQDLQDGYKLHLFQFDGSPVAPLFLVSEEPNMLPTRPLRNDTPSFVAQSLIKTNDAASASWTPGGIVSLASTLLTVAVGAFVL